MQQDSQAHIDSYEVPRRADRVDRSISAVVVRNGQPDLEVTVHNLSPHGFRMSPAGDLAQFSFFYLRFRDGIVIPAQVRWSDSVYSGCEFPKPLTSRQYLKVLGSQGEADPAASPAGLIARIRAALTSRRV